MRWNLEHFLAKDAVGSHVWLVQKIIVAVLCTVSSVWIHTHWHSLTVLKMDTRWELSLRLRHWSKGDLSLVLGKHASKVSVVIHVQDGNVACVWSLSMNILTNLPLLV